MHMLLNTNSNISKLTNFFALIPIIRKANGDKAAEIQELKVEEYAAVSGGPQVRNETKG